ncbi:MAG: DUF2207 domain-containing protein, partial [Mogibacterium sp.]|nr:DUF2207 domain-containing protein [Mogibacterium sp.]
EIKGEHVVSMLLSLADQGYLKIREFEATKGKLIKRTKTDYEFIKARDYDDAAPEEQMFLDGLFLFQDSICASDLVNDFYTTVDKIKDLVESKYKDVLYDKRAEHYATILNIAGVAGIAALVILSRILNGSSFLIDGAFIMSIMMLLFQIGLPAAAFFLIGKRIQNGRKNPVPYILWLLLAAVGVGIARVFDTFVSWQTVPFLIGMVMCLLLFVMGGFCQRRTDYYTDMLGRIYGYRNFLKVAEKSRMEELAERDPGYFYRNLAYAFALGVTGVYTKRFAPMASRPPEWYDSPYTGYDTFNAARMCSSMDSMMSSVSTSMTSSPSGDGGGSFSGGGGGGGGGGGSW